MLHAEIDMTLYESGKENDEKLLRVGTFWGLCIPKCKPVAGPANAIEEFRCIFPEVSYDPTGNRVSTSSMAWVN